MEPFLAQPQPCRSLAYSLVNVHCHGQVVPGKDRRVVVEAALGTDVELRTSMVVPASQLLNYSWEIRKEYK